MDNSELRNFAYLGDAVWELFVREITVNLTNNPKKLHSITIQRVNASYQAQMLNLLSSDFTEEESEIVRRARNLPVPISRRHIQSEYRQATAFEAIIGYWHLTDKSKLLSKFEFMKSQFSEEQH